MIQTPTIAKITCYHCGDDCLTREFQIEEKQFCCHGCKSVFEILSANKLCSYYNYNDHPGATRSKTDRRFDYLSDPTIISELIDYTDEKITVVNFYIPNIHCSSCLWLLEQLNKINPAVHYCRVDFLKKQLNIRFDHNKLILKELVELLYDIGYEPMISLQDIIKNQNVATKDNLVSKIAVAGFCFGNVMLLSFPEYLGISSFEQSFKFFFGIVNILICLPVVLYSGWGYFVSAWQNLQNKVLNIDFPLALGIAVLFVRSVLEVMTKSGTGFSDTLCGLVFFLLVGKFVQRKTYHHISFERDYRSFFPVAVNTIDGDAEKPISLSQLKTYQRIIIRHNEIIPADAILLKGEALIDFSFVTGESLPVSKTLGEIIYAGGRQTGESIELEVVKAVSQSYLTQLWNNEAFKRNQDNRMQTFNEKVSKYFTVVLLVIAFSTLFYWLHTDYRRGLAGFTAVLIVACPCALALSTPFTMSAALSIFDRNLFYLKNTAVVEQLARINTIVLDKTGTITTGESEEVKFQGLLSGEQSQLVFSTCINSGHPLSRMICQHIGPLSKQPITKYTEIPGEGIIALIGDHQVKAGNAKLIFGQSGQVADSTQVYIMIDGDYLGYFTFAHQYRPGMQALHALEPAYRLQLLSGDRDHERIELMRFFNSGDHMLFNQSPQEILDFISS